jgi:hypothetical protein
MPITLAQPLTREQVAKIEAERSHYGCGVRECVACYPLLYGCEMCGIDFAMPIRNGWLYECEPCGWDNLEHLN